MRCTVYSSKAYCLVVLAILFGVGSALFHFYWWMPIFVQITFWILLGLGILAVLYSLFSRKPVLVVDETGIGYQPRWYPKFEWKDVVSVERMPRVQKKTDGEIHSYLSISSTTLRQPRCRAPVASPLAHTPSTEDQG